MFLYDILAFMLYLYLFIFLIFLLTLSFSMKFSIMTSPSNYDVTHFLIDFNENCTAYVKLNSKIFLFVELFLFFFIFGIFIEKITIYYENPVYCTVTLHLPPDAFWAAH